MGALFVPAELPNTCPPPQLPLAYAYGAGLPLVHGAALVAPEPRPRDGCASHEDITSLDACECCMRVGDPLPLPAKKAFLGVGRGGVGSAAGKGGELFTDSSRRSTSEKE